MTNMKSGLYKYGSFAVVVLFVLSLMSFLLQPAGITVYLAGDSTMADKEIKYYPETGWGMPFKAFFDQSVRIDNKAKNGRSTKSFIAEGLWASIADNLKEGDYVLIQFGHNDEVPTKANATTEEVFTANLVRFVSETRAKKSNPVLITPVARRKFNAAGTVEGTHNVYSELVRKVAATQRVPLIDLDKESQAMLQKYGAENSKLLYNHLEPGENPNYPDGKVDDTHFSELGARKMAEIVLADIRLLKLELADRIVKTANKATVWNSTAEPLAAMQQVRKLIKVPVFKKRDFRVTAYGAVGDGKTMNTQAFKKAIEACSKSGGGRVLVPLGTFLTGPIYLESNVNLHLADSAKILFSRNPKDYPIVFTRWEGMECMNYSAQIYAYGEENIAVTGNGILDGNADRSNWWNWNGSPNYGWKEGMPKQTPARTKLHELMHQQTDPKTRIFGEGGYLRPNMLQPYNCKNVLISDVKMINSPMWFMNPVLCENVTVDKVKVISHGPNNDGCDPESCKNVIIKNCLFDTGDDCIAIKSGRDEDGRRIGRPAENHIVENCEMKDGHGGVTIGSEIAGGARNIFAINCVMDSPNLDRVLRLKTSSSRGGIIENVFMKDIKVGSYKDAVVSADMFYEAPGNFIPTIRNIWVENVNVTKGGNFGVYVRAYKESPVQNLRLVNCNFLGVKTPFKIDYTTDLKFENLVINGLKASVPEVIK